MTGIEPAFSAWEADVLPLNYTRVEQDDVTHPPGSPPPSASLQARTGMLLRMEEHGRHDGHWSEGLVREMRRRGWLMPMVTALTASALAVTGCGVDDSSATVSQSARDSRSSDAATTGGETVAAVVETDPVPNSGDAADDPAIWVDRDDPRAAPSSAPTRRAGSRLRPRRQAVAVPARRRDEQRRPA